MNWLLPTHSLLRYLVLLFCATYALYCLWALAAKKRPTALLRVGGAAYVGLLDVQVLLGLALLARGRFYPALIGHIAMMGIAATLSHAMLAVNRRLGKPGYLLPFIAVAASLLLMLGGVMAIGRSPL